MANMFKTLQDPSLFEVNARNEQDIIQQLQDVSPKDQLRDDEIDEIERMDNEILQKQLDLQQEEEEEEEQSDEDGLEVDEDGLEVEEDDLEEDLPLDFKNHDDTEFFDHPPLNHQDDDDDDDIHYEDIEDSVVEPPSIPWHPPSHYSIVDTSSFYQDQNATLSIQKSRFKLWHSIPLLVVFVLIYRWSIKKWNRDQKDCLPLHNTNSNTT
ncbi:hypothetical protein K501DRAFT_332096, partial [Backusella circina FSU 941]